MKDEESNGTHHEDEIIVIKSYNNEVYADIDAGHLKANNIWVYVSKDDPALVGMQRGARLMVKHIDKARALKVLEAMH